MQLSNTQTEKQNIMKTLSEKKLERITNKYISLGVKKETSIELAKQEIKNEEVCFSNKMERMTTNNNEHNTLYDGTQLR